MNEAKEKIRTISDLLTVFSKEIVTWLRQEAKLARTEMDIRITRVKAGGILLAGGAAFIFFGVLALLAAGVIALAIVMPWWLAALVVGIIALILGGGLLILGVRKIKFTEIYPQETIGAIREDIQWLKNQLTSG